MKLVIAVKQPVFLTLFMSASVVWLASVICLAQKPELVVQTGHSYAVTSAAFSPDGKTLASGSADHTIKLWEAGTGRELRTLAGHTDYVNSVAFSPDGQTLASVSRDHTIKLWEVGTGRELRALTEHTAPVTSVAFSPDGKTLASGSMDRTIKLWEVGTGRQVRTLGGHTKGADSVSPQVTSVAFSPDGKTLASGTMDKTVQMWEVSTGRKLLTLTGHTNRIKSVGFSANGKTLASGSWDSTIKLWEVDTGRELRTLAGHTGVVDSVAHRVNSVAFSFDGKMLASGTGDEAITLWEVGTGRELRTLIGHTASVNSVAFAPDGKMLASGSDDHTIKLWEAGTGRELRTLTGHTNPISSIAFSPDGQTLASGRWPSHTIKLWDVGTGRELRTLTGHTHAVNSVAFSPDGKMLASGSGDYTIKLWEVATGRELRALTGHTNTLISVAFSPDGKTLASGSSDNTIKLWEVATGRELHTLTEHTNRINSIAFSLDGKMLGSVSMDGTIKLWEVETGRVLRTLSGHTDSNSSISFSADGKTLAGNWVNTIKLWEVATGRELHTLTGHTASVTSVAFSPDGKKLASGGWDNTIKLWEVATGRELHTLTGHTASVTAVAFSPGGKALASCSWDGTIKLWRVESGELLTSLIALDEADWAVVAPDGLFDGSPGALKLMHWMVESEPITLEQLKERYWEPALLAKLMGFNKEPLRNVSKFENPRLYPDVKYEAPTKGSSTLAVTLTNRGGGIGPVQVYVNGKRFLKDARDVHLKENPDVKQATLNIDLSKASGIKTGEENRIRVVSSNAEGYISSPGYERAWAAGGPTNSAPLEVYAIIGGVSDYADPKLNLHFAAKDAVDIANAIELGANRLFYPAKIHLWLLTTADDPRAIAPTKDHFNKAFADARQAQSKDILIVYLAGHGITLQQGNDTYCYLTQEARTTDTAALSDPEVRRQQTITIQELVEWLKQIDANKQVVMLDTCAAGAALGSLMNKREPPGDAIRAIDQAKESSGSYFLLGSAADAVSYEVSQYGQGLLTYALLKGMSGPGLKDREYVDIETLFIFARDEVQRLATNIGGIQKPLFPPLNGESFRAGWLSAEDKQKIVLATPKPYILRPQFFDSQADYDRLGLVKRLSQLLRDESYVIGRGKSEGGLSFVDDEEFPAGIMPTGRYTVEGNMVTVTLRLRRDRIEIGNAQQVTGTKDNIAEKVIEAVKAAIRKL
jgi:WD40 repeat protein